MERLRAIPAGAPIDFEVTADDDTNADIIAALRMTSDVDDKWIPTTRTSPPNDPTGARRDKAEEQQRTPPSVGSYPCVIVTRRCALRCEVWKNEIQLRFGDNDIGLQFYLNFLGFAKFMRLASDTVTRLRAIPDRTYISFKVSDDKNERPREVDMTDLPLTRNE